MRGPWRGTHQLEHQALGLPEAHAVLQAYPSTPQVYFSPIAGDPDASTNIDLSTFFPVIIGFLQPKSGVLTDIGMVTQGNTGSGVSRAVRWGVASVKTDPTATVGFRLAEILATGLTNVADNYNGLVTLATGLSLAVPSHLALLLHAPYRSTASEKIYAQGLRSGGPIPGVAGHVFAGSPVVSAVSYLLFQYDINDPPAEFDPAADVLGGSFKGAAAYIKWRGQ